MVTAIDLRPDRFHSGCLVQTIVAEVPAIILCSELGASPVFHVLGNSSSALYVWTCLEDALLHSGGGLVGLAALLSLKDSSE